MTCEAVENGLKIRRGQPRGGSTPFPAPSLFLSKSSSSNYLRSLRFFCRAKRVFGSRCKNGYSAYPLYFDRFRKSVSALMAGRYVQFLLFTLDYGVRGG